MHGTVGYNYRLTNIQAALGVAQLEKLNEYINIKRTIAKTYTEALRHVPGVKPMIEADWAFSMFWLFTVLINPMEFGMDSRALMRQLDANKIQARPLWQPAHLSPAHRGMRATDCSVAERLNYDALSLPSSVGLANADQQRVIRSFGNLQ